MSYELVVKEERRVFERYIAVKQAFSLDQKSFGIVKNISLGGVSIYCLNDSRQGESSNLDIFLGGASFSLFPNQYSLVCQGSTPGQALKIHHIRFNDLPSAQINSLWHLIKNSCLPAVDKQFYEDQYSQHVSSERHVGLPQLRALRPNSLAHLSHNNDKSPFCSVSIVQ